MSIIPKGIKYIKCAYIVVLNICIGISGFFLPNAYAMRMFIVIFIPNDVD